MPTAAEAFIIILIAVVVMAAARLLTLGDALGAALRGMIGRDSAKDSE
jgi:Sec-independent protein translocase protein TatA